MAPREVHHLQLGIRNSKKLLEPRTLRTGPWPREIDVDPCQGRHGWSSRSPDTKIPWTCPARLEKRIRTGWHLHFRAALPPPSVPPPSLLFTLLPTLRAKTKDADAKGEKPSTAFSAFYSGPVSLSRSCRPTACPRVYREDINGCDCTRPGRRGVRTAEALRSTGCARATLGASPALRMRRERTEYPFRSLAFEPVNAQSGQMSVQT